MRKKMCTEIVQYTLYAISCATYPGGSSLPIFWRVLSNWFWFRFMKSRKELWMCFFKVLCLYDKILTINWKLRNDSELCKQKPNFINHIDWWLTSIGFGIEICIAESVENVYIYLCMFEKNKNSADTWTMKVNENCYMFATPIYLFCTSWSSCFCYC